MSTVSKSFTELGLSAELSVKPGQSVSYSASGTFTGFVFFERSRRSNVWERVAGGEADTGFSGSVKNETQRDERFRFRAIDTDSETPFTGTAVCEVADVNDTLQEFKRPDGSAFLRVTDEGVEIPGDALVENELEVTGAQATGSGVGAKAGATVSVVEGGNSVVHRTTLTLVSTPVEIISVTTGNGVGGTKIYDFPEGRILVLGCMADLAIAVAAAEQANFTDGSTAGDIGIGSVAPANADALGTDATDDDMATATAFAMTDHADAEVLCPSESGTQFDGTTTPLEALVNVLVDAGDIDDDAITEVLVSGTVVLTWINLGDF